MGPFGGSRPNHEEKQMSEIRVIDVKEGILADNDRNAEQLREQLRAEKTFLLNLMASPGAGKTTTILKTLAQLPKEWKVGVMEADIDSVVDAELVAAAGAETVQIHTGGMCHLDAEMTRTGLQALGTEQLDLVILENVGNLVCPAEFDTGASCSTMILSVPEGDDKPLKYPLMFTICDAVVINKIDCVSLFDFNFEAFKSRVKKLNPKIAVFEVSAKTGEGIDAWVAWLRGRVEAWNGVG